MKAGNQKVERNMADVYSRAGGKESPFHSVFCGIQFGFSSMKISKFIILLLILAGGRIVAAPALTGANQNTLPAPTPYAVIQNDANSRVWERITYEKSPTGQIIPKKHHVTELATGLNHRVNGQWVESKEEIDVLPNGTAAATNGQHQAYFPGDIYNGVIEVVTPDGLHLQSQPLGLSYFDGTNSVLIAELTNSIGYVVGSNQVIYPNAFANFAADLRYTFTKSGFEQDIILRESPLTPESYGLNPDTTRLQILTEFFNTPQPSIAETPLPEQAGIALNDDNLSFGQMDIVPGTAFLLGANNNESKVMVAKQWETFDGRYFLVEEVPVNALADKLATLPVSSVSASSKSALTSMASSKLKLPPQHFTVKTNSQPMRFANIQPLLKGVVLDYQAVVGTATNVTFSGDDTYYVSGIFTLKGTNTIEGGAVIKYANNGQITMGNPAALNCQTASYRPAILTGMDDDSVGEIISGSTGSPTNYYGTYINLNGTTNVLLLSNLRIMYANIGINIANGGMLPNLFDAQFVTCNYAVDHADQDNTVEMDNVYLPISKPTLPITSL